MALTITEANAVQSKYFDKQLSQIAYEKSPFFYALKKMGNVVLDGGNQLQWPVRYKEYDRAKFVDPDKQIHYQTKNTRTGAVLDWKYMIVDGLITWEERVKNSGKSQIVNLLSDKTNEIMEDMYEVFADAIFATTQETDKISSLETIIDSSDTYGGISPTDATLWAAQEDSTTTELVLYGQNSLSYLINLATFGDHTVDCHFTTRDLLSKFESLVEPQMRYQKTELGDAGFRSVAFHGKPVVSDVHCADNRWYGICKKDWEIRYHPDYNFVKTPWKELFQAGHPHHMAKTCTWAGEVVCRNRRTNFKFTALDYTK